MRGIATINNCPKNVKKFIICRVWNGKIFYYDSTDDHEKAYDILKGCENAFLLERERKEK